MGKHFEHTVESAASVSDVYAVLSGADWADRLAAHLKDDSRVVERIEAPDGGVRLVMSRGLPGAIPPALAKFLPNDPRVVVTDVWSGSRGGGHDCAWTAEISGAPARIRGVQHLSPTDSGGNRHEISGEVKVSVPLIGGKAEAFIAEQVLKLVIAEVGVVQQVLGDP